MVKHLGSTIVSIMESNSMAKISSLVDNGHWNISSSNHVLVFKLRRLLHSFSFKSVDAVCWNDNKLVSLSAIWDSIRQRATPPPWLQVVWHPLCIPKCAFFCWLAFKNRLLTKDTMLMFGFNVDNTCLLCQSGLEIVDHIFSSCPVAYLILKSSPVTLTHNWSDWCNGNFFQQ